MGHPCPNNVQNVALFICGEIVLVQLEVVDVQLAKHSSLLEAFLKRKEKKVKSGWHVHSCQIIQVVQSHANKCRPMES